MNPADQVATTCPATTQGPAEIPCQRTDPHTVGHVFDAGDVADRHDTSEGGES